jgi:hypothetical protein
VRWRPQPVVTPPLSFAFHLFLFHLPALEIFVAPRVERTIVRQTTEEENMMMMMMQEKEQFGSAVGRRKISASSVRFVCL